MFRSLNKNCHGITIIEFIVVIAIFAILAALVPAKFVSYRKQSYDAAANADIKSLYLSCQAYFNQVPTGACTAAVARSHGFTPTANVTTVVSGASRDTFAATSKHSSGRKTYSVDSAGTITSA